MCLDVINSDTAILEEDLAVGTRGVWNGRDVGQSEGDGPLVKIVLEDADVIDSTIKSELNGRIALSQRDLWSLDA